MAVVSKVADQIITVTPVLFHLDPAAQVDLGPHKALTVRTSHGTDFFKHVAVFADNDSLVAGLFTVDHGFQVNNTAVFPLGKALNLNSGSVGNLTVQAPQELFPDDFCHDLPFGLVGDHAVRKELRPLLGVFFHLGEQFVKPLIVSRGDRDHSIKVKYGAVGSDHREQIFFAFERINLVDHKNHRDAALTEKFRIGDSVTVYPDAKIGIVCEPVNEDGYLRVQIADKKIRVSHKRVKLKVKAEELYPEDYDLSIIFDPVDIRKKRHDMSRKYTDETIVFKEVNK